MKTKVYALCGIFWFIMDCFWYWKLFYPALIFGGLTTATSICGLLIYNQKKNTEFYIVLATFAWIMINMCSLVGDMSVDLHNETLNNFLKLFAFISMLIALQSLIAVALSNRSLFEKFKKL